MRIELNLAKEPFRNRSMFWLGMTAALLVAFTALALVVARAAHVGADTETLRDERSKQEKTIADLDARLKEITDANEHAIFSDADRVALDDARELLNERSFSWSRLLSDLEPAVPKDARLSSIAIVNMSGDGAERVVKLGITGRGKSFSQMALFINNLDQSGGRFAAEPVSNGEADKGAEFDFTVAVTYRPGIGAAPVAAPSEERKGDA